MNILSLQRQLTCPRGQSLSRRFEPIWTPAALGSSLALWLDAADASTITLNGSTVSQWNDKSGNGRHATQATAANQPTYNASALLGKPCLQFSGPATSNMQASVPAGTFATNLNVFLVRRKTGANNTFESLGVVRTNGAQGAPLDYWGANFYVGNGSTSTVHGSAPNAQTITTANIWGVQAASVAPFATVRLDGGTAYQSSTASTYGDVGTQIQLGARGNLVTKFTGDMGEVVVLSGAMSDTDRQKLEGYLAWKWGLQANLPGDHPYRYDGSLFGFVAVSWTPAQLPSLAAWYDANDASTITLNGSTVAQWNDKSGNGRHATQATAALQPAYEAAGMNGKPTLNNLSGRRLQTGTLPVLKDVSGATLVAVAQFTTPLAGGISNGMLLYVNNGVTVGATRLGLTGNPVGGSGTYSMGGRRLDADTFATTNSPTALTVNPTIWIGNANYATAQTSIWLNGAANVVNASFQTAGNTSNTDSLGLAVFSTPSGNLNTYDNTRLSEALIIDATLSTTDRQLLEGYLAWKWSNLI